MTIKLESKNYCNSGTRQWTATSDTGEKIGSVLRGNRPFAEYRLILTTGEIIRFSNQKTLLEFQLS